MDTNSPKEKNRTVVETAFSNVDLNEHILLDDSSPHEHQCFPTIWSGQAGSFPHQPMDLP